MNFIPPNFPENFNCGGDDIEVYARTMGEPFNSREDRCSCGAEFANLLSDVGLFLGRRVLAEVEKRPDTRFRYSLKGFRLKQGPSPEDRTLILKHLADQTGYTFTEERRPVRVLRIERAE